MMREAKIARTSLSASIIKFMPTYKRTMREYIAFGQAQGFQDSAVG
jgi:hypothetical protein